MSIIQKIVLHAGKSVPKEQRDGKMFGRTTGLRRLAFLDELLYANYRRQRTDSQLVRDLKAEFNKEREFQPMKKYRYYFNTAHPQHGMGIGRPLTNGEALPEFGTGPGCVLVGSSLTQPKLIEQLRANATHLPRGPSKSVSTKLGPRKSRIGRFADVSAIEGQKTEVVRLVSKRHRGLRNRALLSANGICCVCNTDFSKLLDGKGVRVLQVHHREQLSASAIPRETTLKDLAVVCANCHVLLHLDPKRAMKVEKLALDLRQ